MSRRLTGLQAAKPREMSNLEKAVSRRLTGLQAAEPQTSLQNRVVSQRAAASASATLTTSIISFTSCTRTRWEPFKTAAVTVAAVPNWR